MTDSERKIKLKEMIASLSPSQLRRAYKEINNYLNSQSDSDDWAPDVTPEEKEAIEAGLKDLKNGKTTPHELVMEKLKNRHKK